MANEEIQVPLTDFVKQIAREAAQEVIKEHVATCQTAIAFPASVERLRKLEIKTSTLIGFMAGSGALGGGIGAIAAKLMG